MHNFEWNWVGVLSICDVIFKGGSSFMWQSATEGGGGGKKCPILRDIIYEWSLSNHCSLARWQSDLKNKTTNFGAPWFCGLICLVKKPNVILQDSFISSILPLQTKCDTGCLYYNYNYNSTFISFFSNISV